jgi:hypothetical protein
MGSAQQGGWGFQILPFVEQDALWRGNVGSIANAQIQVISTPVKTFFCPSRRPPQVLPATGSWYGPGGTYPHAPTDYAAGNIENTGVIVYGYQGIRIADVTDGTANTLIFGDKRLDKANLNNYQSDDNEGYTSGWDHDTIRRTAIQPMPDSNNGSSWGEERFGSSHPTNFMVALVDGSVRSVSYSISLTTFSNLGSRNDGQVLGSDF